MEQARRDRFATHVPSTWEIPAAVIGTGVCLILITPLIIQGMVAWASTGGFAWPRRHLDEAYGGLLHGHFGTGLRREVAAHLPSDTVMWLLTVAGEVLVLGVAVLLGRWLRELAGTSARHGLATTSQATEALGLSRLRQSAAMIRPDLYPRARRTNIGQRATGRRTDTHHGAPPGQRRGRGR